MPPQNVKKKGKERKQPFIEKLAHLLETHDAVFLVGCNNIGSTHMQKIKRSIRDKAIFVKGKNTLIRRSIKQNSEKHPEWLALLPYIKGNVGLVFANGDLRAVKNNLLNLRVAAAAKVGIVAPEDVVVPKGGTGLEPTKTSFLQALNIASKINRGQIEILQDVLLIRSGFKVGNSESTLLQMLGIKPFSYGLTCNYVYEDGKVYPAKLMETDPETVMQRFAAGVSTVAAISLSIGLPTIASVPHSILNAYKNLLAISIETDFVFEQAMLVKEMLENPDAFVQEQEPEVIEDKEDEPEVVDEPPEVEDKPEDKEEEDVGFAGFFDD